MALIALMTGLIKSGIRVFSGENGGSVKSALNALLRILENNKDFFIQGQSIEG